MTMRKKSINDLDAQFSRIWQACIESCDCYQELFKQTDGRLEPWQYFQTTDNRLRSGVGLSDKDRRNDSRIVRVADVARRYMNNLRRIGGFNDSTGYLATGERMEAYQKFRDLKFPVDRYMVDILPRQAEGFLGAYAPAQLPFQAPASYQDSPMRQCPASEYYKQHGGRGRGDAHTQDKSTPCHATLENYEYDHSHTA